MNRWVKYPGPGQFRGEGEWVDFDLTFMENSEGKVTLDEYWDWLVSTKYLPTHEGEEKPE